MADAEAKMEAFLRLHQAQLAAARVPQHLWPIVYYKLQCVAPRSVHVRASNVLCGPGTSSWTPEATFSSLETKMETCTRS